MDLSVKTQTQTSISRKGDKITIKEIETTTTTRRGMAPEVKVVERVKEYDVNNIPDDLRRELGEIAEPDSCPRQKKKSSSQGWIQGPSQQKLGVASGSERAAPAVTPPTQINENDLEQLNVDGVKCHNEYRKRHGVNPLAYNKELAGFAQNWAEELARKEKFEHRKQDRYGENLYMFYSSNPAVVASASAACDSWYNEIKGYVFGQEPKNMSAGHFTQMIWKGTREVGMGRARASSGKQIIVANYDPPGNFIGSFAVNVPKPV